MMASITGTTYWQICILAIIPALFYFFSIGVAVELRARRAGVSPSRETVDKKLIARRALLFFVPLAVIFWFLARVLGWGLIGIWWGIFLVTWGAALITLFYGRYLMKRTFEASAPAGRDAEG